MQHTGNFLCIQISLQHLPILLSLQSQQHSPGKRQSSPFLLAAEQLIRFYLVCLEENLFRLYLTAHHLVIDGVAIYQVFLPDLYRIYRSPESPAILFEDQMLCYAEMDQRANRLANHLIDLGVGPEQIVVVWTNRTAGHIIALLAVLKAGAGDAPRHPGDSGRCPPGNTERHIPATIWRRFRARFHADDWGHFVEHR